MAFSDLLQQNSGNKMPTTGGSFSDFAKSVTFDSDKRKQAQRDYEAAQFESNVQNSFWGMAKNTIKAIPDVLTGGTNFQGSGPVSNTLANLGNIYGNLPSQLIKHVQTGAQELQAGNVAGLGIAGFRTAADTLGALYAPLGEAISAALKVTGGQKVIDKTGEVVADKSGITDWPAFQEFAISHPNAGEDFNRLLILATAPFEKGRIGTDKTFIELSKQVARKVIAPVPKGATEPAGAGFRKLKIQNMSGETKVPVTPMEKLAQESRANGYEPYLANNELPTIPFGPSAKSGLPTIQMESPTMAPPGMRYESIPAAPNIPARAPIEIAASVGEPVQPTLIGAKAPTGDGVTKVAQSIEAKAVEKNLVSQFNELATYDQKTVADQANRVARIIDDGDARISRIISGEEKLPSGVSSSMFIKGVEDYAGQTGNALMLRDLSKSPLTSETSIHAQEMRFLQERSQEVTPLKAMQELADARKSKQKGDILKAKRTEINSIESEIQKQIPRTKQTWVEFINSIEC